MFQAIPLICHPATPAPANRSLTAHIRPTADRGLQFVFAIQGISGIKLPPLATPQARDGLWQHTCCEAFIAGSGCTDYHEFNFSPSGCWAVYRFHNYRDRDLGWSPPAVPTIETLLQPEFDRCLLIANVPVRLLPDTPRLDIALTAVIEEQEALASPNSQQAPLGNDNTETTNTNNKTYWALAHDAPTPDFHRRSSFILTLDRP